MAFSYIVYVICKPGSQERVKYMIYNLGDIGKDLDKLSLSKTNQ